MFVVGEVVRTRLLLAVQQCHTATTPFPKSRVRRRLSPATCVPRPLCLCVKVPRLSLLPHARLAFSHTVRLVPTQRLLGSPVQSLTAAPHHEPSGGVQPHHERHPSLRSARSPASLSKRVIRVTQERTKPKTVPQKNKPCLLGLTESSSQRNPRPHKPPNQRKNHKTDTISPSSVTCTLRLGIHQRNALWGFLCDVPRTTLTSSG